jgi:chemotaxis protein methyltransferase CheR
MADAPGRSGSTHGFKAEALGLSTTSLALLRDLIVEHTGQYFDDRKLDLLADKITDLIASNGSSSVLDYYYLLKYDNTTDNHWRELLDKLAVPETYFWRQPEQFEALADVVVPEFIERHPGKPLRIWSAACCTGEEPLSIAMALDRAGLFERADIRIDATDASEAMIARARTGLYGERAMRSIPTSLRDSYFTRTDRGWRIDPKLHARVSWGRANLAAPAEVARFAGADVIYCRNVLIYFSDDAIRSVAATLARYMPRGGVLFLGASESLLRLSTEFSMIEIGSAFAYTPGLVQEDTTAAFNRAGSTRNGRSRV